MFTPHILGDAVKNPKQPNALHLLTEQLRFDERRLAASFVEMSGALPRRPAPEHLFHNAASPGRVGYRGLVLVVAARAVMRDAIKTGDRAIIEESARRIDHHFEDAKDCALRQYREIATGEVSLADATELASRETADLSVALTHLALYQDEAARDQTVREIDAEILRLSTLRAQLTTSMPQALNRRAALALS